MNALILTAYCVFSLDQRTLLIRNLIVSIIDDYRMNNFGFEYVGCSDNDTFVSEIISKVILYPRCVQSHN